MRGNPKPDEAAVRRWLKHRATKRTAEHAKIGDRMEMNKLCQRFRMSPEALRAILKAEGWKLELSPNAGLPFWWP
jgi:hypothetical protein